MAVTLAIGECELDAMTRRRSRWRAEPRTIAASLSEQGHGGPGDGHGLAGTKTERKGDSETRCQSEGQRASH